MSLKRLLPARQRVALHSTDSTRAIETQAQNGLPAASLMQRAGASVAQLTRALAPHARHVVIVCGPGNNGGDGLVAATALHALSQANQNRVSVLFSHHPPRQGDAAVAWEQAQAAGVPVIDAWPADTDVAIDAIFGIGARAPLDAPTCTLLARLQTAPLLLAVDIPTGLNADTGAWHAPLQRMTAQQRHTLALLTAKPGLFTAAGRDWAGEVWLDDLGVAADAITPADAALGECAPPRTVYHDSHKGTHGEVCVIGGQWPLTGRIGMVGAAVLAARAALHHGAGRVVVAPLGEPEAATFDALQPDLMWANWSLIHKRLAHTPSVWLAGCGGGEAIAPLLADLLAHRGPLVLDADAINALAVSPQLAAQLRLRGDRPTVLTPHPQEAARLLGCSTREVQADRLRAATQLASNHQALVVLKGSGTVIAAPGQAPLINSSGNGRLAIAGTGDVLAGMIAATLAGEQQPSTAGDLQTHVARCVWWHGHLADRWPGDKALTAAALASACGSDQHRLQNLQDQDQD